MLNNILVNIMAKKVETTAKKLVSNKLAVMTIAEEIGELYHLLIIESTGNMCDCAPQISKVLSKLIKSHGSVFLGIRSRLISIGKISDNPKKTKRLNYLIGEMLAYIASEWEDLSPTIMESIGDIVEIIEDKAKENEHLAIIEKSINSIQDKIMSLKSKLI